MYSFIYSFISSCLKNFTPERKAKDITVYLPGSRFIDCIRVGHAGFTAFYREPPDGAPSLDAFCQEVISDINHPVQHSSWTHLELHHHNLSEMQQAHTHATSVSGYLSASQLTCILQRYYIEGDLSGEEAIKIRQDFSKYEISETKASAFYQEAVAADIELKAKEYSRYTCGFGQAFLLSFFNYYIENCIVPFLREKCYEPVAIATAVGLYGLTKLSITGSAGLSLILIQKGLDLALKKMSIPTDHWIHKAQDVAFIAATVCLSWSLLECGSALSGAMLGAQVARQVHQYVNATLFSTAAANHIVENTPAH